MIFVNSMSDLFHKRLPLDYIAQVFETRSARRGERSRCRRRGTSAWPISRRRSRSPERVDGHQRREQAVALRADFLRTARSAVRFISAEPLLGELAGLNLTGTDWLIAGGEPGRSIAR